MTQPKENRTQPGLVLIEQFLLKGYKCRKLKEEDATILILSHSKTKVSLTQKLQPFAMDSYRDLLKNN